MYSEHHNASPVNPLPPVIVALALVIAGVELAFQMGVRGLVGGPEAVGWRLLAVERFGFHDAAFDHMASTGQVRPEWLWQLVTYPFVHYSLTHALFGVVILLALGNYASKLYSPVALLAAFFGCAAGAAAIYGLTGNTRTPLIGMFPAVYGLIGLYTWMLWVAAEELGQNRYAAFRLIGVLVALQLVFGLIGGFYRGLVADIAGFVLGFALATPLAPGGLQRLRRRLRGY